MRNSSIFAEAANLLLKRQGELTRLADSLAQTLRDHPLGKVFDRAAAQPNFSQSSFALGNADGSVLRGELVNNVLKLVVAYKGMSYSLSLPLQSKELSELTATVTVTGDGEPKEFTWKGEDFFKGTGLAAEFADLHAKAVAYVASAMPWLKRSSDTASSAQPEQPAEASAAQAEPTSTAPTSTSDTAYEQILVARDNGKTLKFEGKLLASAQTIPQRGRFWELGVFGTRGGKFVAYKAGRSLWTGERDKIEALVFETPEAVQEFFGDNPLARTLYSRAGFDFFELVD